MAAGVVVEPPIPPTPPTPANGGGGGYTARYHDKEKEDREKRDREEREGMYFIVEFLKTATDIINNQ